jgi:acetyltransferase-like isoleucine patch superfamily enzyme
LKKHFLYFSYIVASFTGKIISYIWPLRFSTLIDHYLQIVYTQRIIHLFKSFGDGASIQRKATLIGGQYISIGNDVCIMSGAILTAWDGYDFADQLFSPEIYIGDGTVIGEQSHITAINKIFIGKNVLCGRCLTVTDNGHGLSDYNDMKIPPRQRPLYSKGPVVIEDNVWLGDKVTVLSGVIIGRNSIIAANSVVTKDVLPYSVVGGNPIRLIKNVFPK